MFPFSLLVFGNFVLFYFCALLCFHGVTPDFCALSPAGIEESAPVAPLVEGPTGPSGCKNTVLSFFFSSASCYRSPCSSLNLLSIYSPILASDSSIHFLRSSVSFNSLYILSRQSLLCGRGFIPADSLLQPSHPSVYLCSS